MHEKKITENFQLSKQDLGNKLSHIHINPKSNSHFFIGIYVKIGSRFENRKEAGISHFLEHMLFRGTKKNPSFLNLAKEFENYGGEWNAATGHEHTEYTYLGLSESALPLIKLFSDIVKEPLLLDPEKEKEIILREIEDEINEHGEFLDLDFHSAQLAWKDSGFQFPITGDKKSVRSLTSKALKDHFEKNYSPENMVICTWGGPDSKEVLDSVKENFNFPSTRSKNSFTPIALEKGLQTAPLFKFVPNTDNQYQVQLSFYCDGEWSPKTKLYTLLCHLLSNGFSSRLSQKLREEKGLVYSISAHLTSFLDRGLLNITYASTEETFLTAFEELLLVLSQLMNEGISEEELKRSTNQELLELVSLAHNPESFSFFLARNKHWEQEFSLEQAIKSVRETKKEDLEKEIRNLFQNSKSLLVIMGPKELNLKKQCLNLLQKHLG